MRESWRSLLILIAVIVSIPLIILFLIRITPDPPVALMENAMLQLSHAGTKRANTYSKKLYTEAKILYDSAMANWQRENKKFIFSRNYEKVAKFAERSAQKSAQASDNSVISSANLNKTIAQKIDTLDNIVANINKFFNDF